MSKETPRASLVVTPSIPYRSSSVSFLLIKTSDPAVFGDIGKRIFKDDHEVTQATIDECEAIAQESTGSRYYYAKFYKMHALRKLERYREVLAEIEHIESFFHDVYGPASSSCLSINFSKMKAHHVLGNSFELNETYNRIPVSETHVLELDRLGFYAETGMVFEGMENKIKELRDILYFPEEVGWGEATFHMSQVHGHFHRYRAEEQLLKLVVNPKHKVSTTKIGERARARLEAIKRTRS